AAVAARFAAARVRRAEEPRRVIGPDDDRAAVAARAGRSREARAGPDLRVRRGRGAACAAALTADQDRAAASIARDVDAGRTEHADAVALHVHGAARVARARARGIDRARRDDGAAFAQQPHDAAARVDPRRADRAAVVDDAAEDVLRRARGEQHL